MSKEAIAKQVFDCLAYVDTAVDEKTLIGTSSPPPVAANRLRAFGSMLTTANAMFIVGDLIACYDQFSAASRKCNGEEQPIDFVQGDSRVVVFTQITNLMYEIDQEHARDMAYGSLKAQNKV